MKVFDKIRTILILITMATLALIIYGGGSIIEFFKLKPYNKYFEKIQSKNELHSTGKKGRPLG